MLPDDALFATTWVHAYEEDAGGAAVYRPHGHPLPRSRRPRDRFELHDDGTARVWSPAADDRLLEQPASWTADCGELVVHIPGTSADIRIVEHTSERVVTRRG